MTDWHWLRLGFAGVAGCWVPETLASSRGEAEGSCDEVQGDEAAAEGDSIAGDNYAAAGFPVPRVGEQPAEFVPSACDAVSGPAVHGRDYDARAYTVRRSASAGGR